MAVKDNEKFRKILELWDRNHGVILLSVNHHIHSDEALIREACMIEAIGWFYVHSVENKKIIKLFIKAVIKAHLPFFKCNVYF